MKWSKGFTLLYRPWRPLRENWGIALLFFVHLGTLDGGGWSTPRSGRRYPGKDPALIVQNAGWASELVWIGAENLAPTGIRSPDLPAHSASLYRLSHPVSSLLCVIIETHFFIKSRLCSGTCNTNFVSHHRSLRLVTLMRLKCQWLSLSCLTWEMHTKF